MKKFTFLLVAMFVAFGVSAQVFESVKVNSANTVQPKEDFDVHYDGDFDNAIGVNGEAVFSVVARFTPDELSEYYGNKSISKVKFCINDQFSVGGARILIYGNGTATEPGQLLFEEAVASVEEGWNEYTLPTTLNLESGDYWVGYEVKAIYGFPAGCDAGPMVPGKGGWLYFEGDGWFEMTDAGLDYNWNIRATLTDASGIETEIGQTSNIYGGNGMITINNVDAATAQIFNVTGQLVNSVNLSKSATVQVPAGVYVVRVGNAVQKVLVK